MKKKQFIFIRKTGLRKPERQELSIEEMNMYK